MVVWCPDWPVVVSGVGGAVAVVDGGRVLACSPAARTAGVRRRMPVRQAQARCPGLAIVPRDLGAEARRFEGVAQLLEEVTPRLEVVRPGLAALPLEGPARFAGGPGRLAERISGLLGGRGVPAQAGSAGTLFAAALAARRRAMVSAEDTARFLSVYPVGVLGRPRLVDLLLRLGVETLGAFAQLPPGRVADRFGAEGAAAQRTARGLELRPLDTRVPSQDRAVEVEFDPPQTLLEPLAFAASRVAQELHAALEAAGAVCGQVEIGAGLVDGRVLARRWRHEGRLSALALAERVRWQLQAWSDAGDLGAGQDEDPLREHGVKLLRLVPYQLSPASGRQAALFGQEGLQELEAAAARLQARLGHSAVVRVQLSGGRGPGDRARRVPFGDVADPERTVPGPWPGQLPGPHPARVYPQMPVARLLDGHSAQVGVTARSEVTAPPVELQVQGAGRWPVTGWSGPWTSDESWWDPAEALRAARLLAVTGGGGAWLLRLERGRWWAEAHYG